ncbi:MAG: carboxypeptidase-like regulatory domain-containing protein [Bacteroidales bacterium]|nr:carboxypeptidase-like regulatory domain-containing protein [Bacteroidales bacterium]MDD3521960.1 carboxypeptidase-like regulatory domain-containing protein [Bacteroidales bacterium]MDD4030174.1 carboxypeptidase-like regulatory domain-containing protein [Bacteroidales bacterium]MDD4435231.1 carboxypeptidase-like regulatory domain-containing protein [Bacteroidales bacterium]MDD5732288.1 carboxypeptidase-like regulatory domain-containing protein [Bacteroidales bacterium]
MKRRPGTRQHILLLTLALSFHVVAHTQESYNMRYVTLDSIVQTLERRTPDRFYYAPGQTDTLLITLQAGAGEVLETLGRELKKSGFSLYRVNQHRWAILKGAPLNGIHEAFYSDSLENGNHNRKELSQLADDGIQAADSENRLYTLGNPQFSGLEGTVRLTGYIHEHLSGEPVPGVSIMTEDKKYYTMSDSYGFYSLSIPRGYNTLIIQGFGYKDSRRYLRIFSDSALDLNIAEEVFSLQGIVISAEKMENVRNVRLGLERVRADRIRHIPMAFGEADVIRAVLTLPGVKSVGEAAGGFNVRGGATDQNLILYNQGTIYNSSHLFGLFSLFNNDVISSLELYKSSIPAKYGGRISSVLEVNSREGNKNRFTGSAGIGLLTTKLTLEGPIIKDRTSFLLSGRTTYSDWLMKLIPKESGYNNGSANFYDLNAGISHRFNQNNHLFLNGYFSRDRFSFDPNVSYRYQNINGSVRYRSILTDRTDMVMTLAYDKYNYHMQDTTNAAMGYDLSFSLQQTSFKADFSTRLNGKHKLDYGLNAFYYILDPGTYVPYDHRSLVSTDILQREQAFETALYLSDTWEITPALSVEMGIRYGLYSALGPNRHYLYRPDMPRSLETTIDSVSVGAGKMVTPYHAPEFRFSMRYAFSGDFSVKAGFNSMRQNIHMLSNTTVISPTDIWKLSDANIRPQKGWQTALGFYKNLMNNTLELSVEGYYKHMDRYLDYASLARLLMNHRIETDVIETRGRAYGVEVMLKRSLGRLNGWLSYTYSRTELRQDDPRVAEPVNKGNWYPAPYDKPHDLKLVGNFKFTHRFSFSMNLDYSTGRPMTMPVGTYYYAGGWRLLYGERNAHRIPDYFRLDIAFNIEPSHKLTLLTHSSVTIGVYNVTGRKNPYSVFFQTEGNTVNSYMLSIFGCPIPYITYNIRF